jgi:hypothetical protein
VFLEFEPRATTSIHLHHCSTFSIQLSKNRRAHHASHALYSVHSNVSRDPFTKPMAGYSLQPHAFTTLSHAVNRQEVRAPFEQVGR